MNKQLLEALCNVIGPAGYEDEAQNMVARELKTCCDDVYRDRIGNIIGVKRANRPVSTERPLRVMYCAHNDEQGFRVMDVDDKGYIRLSGLGGPHMKSASGQQIRIEGTETVYGVLVPKNPDAKEYQNYDNMLVYTGCDGDWVKERVRVGDRAVVNVAFSHLNNDIICGRNFDDRLGVFSMIEAVKTVTDLAVDLYAVASVQEEIGTRGAMVASQKIKPDIGIALDGGCVVSPMNNKAQGWTSELGKGAAIYHADRLTICSESLVAFLEQIADRDGIPNHANWWGGTDAHQMQKMGNGAFVTTVGVPSAFMHWANGLADLRDVQAVIDLMALFATEAHEMGVEPDPWTQL